MKRVRFTCPACGHAQNRILSGSDHLECINYDCRKSFSAAELDDATAPLVKWPSEVNDLKKANSSFKTAGKALRFI